MNDETIWDLGDGYRIPRYMRAGLIEYIEHRRPVGDFLTAVLANDLSKAAGHADLTNKAMLSAYPIFLYTYAPSGCWGSYTKVDEWLHPEAQADAN